ncbi:unnamed protein product [Cyclocybe aegerita]|uniref:Uncharacterized protein n=1 Tax=Cyclocybe aegerita TaxID=1973307 RepID=A0A8S0W4B0_CYCAE|nr:unnamed protein product [Cyclocybe aegerita]
MVRPCRFKSQARPAFLPPRLGPGPGPGPEPVASRRSILDVKIGSAFAPCLRLSFCTQASELSTSPSYAADHPPTTRDINVDLRHRAPARTASTLNFNDAGSNAKQSKLAESMEGLENEMNKIVNYGAFSTVASVVRRSPIK